MYFYFNKYNILNILIIEDDSLLSQKLKEVFEKKTITNRVRTIKSYQYFLNELPILSSYDILLVDINLWEKSVKNWIDIVKLIRTKRINIPVVVMSSYNELKWLQSAFECWANDYIIKPFRLKELELRIFKWFKMYLINLNYNVTDNYLFYSWLKYCITCNEFFFNDKSLKLTKKNKYLLFVFMWNNNKLLSERFLIDKVYWDLDLFNNRNIRVDILRLKKVLNTFWINTWIKNIRWEWYIFKKD